jgi:hypothetical protein
VILSVFDHQMLEVGEGHLLFRASWSLWIGGGLDRSVRFFDISGALVNTHPGRLVSAIARTNTAGVKIKSS